MFDCGAGVYMAFWTTSGRAAASSDKESFLKPSTVRSMILTTSS